MTTESIPTPAAVTPPRAYERARWESAILSSDLHRNSRIIAFVLAHHADADGHLPAGGIQHASRLAHLGRITPRQARLSLTQLGARGFITRPDIATWEPQDEVVRPITLSMAASSARRQTESHTGGSDEQR
ncbi:hypothetical protein AB0E00_36800 [Streptomyces sp. NPDC048110]|uniref:hypothetical protein n=1 Tax=Streptomyces sp. NPDC048110 TaxID=3155483 RepID=UPI0033EB56BC